MEKSNNFKLTEYCSIAQLKRKFKSYLDSLDQRRNTNWRTLFAWLDNSFE